MKIFSTCFEIGARVGIVVACTLSTVATSAAAQKTAIVMAHGIRSAASTWDSTAAILQRSYPVNVYRQTTTWTNSYESQATTLSEEFAGLSDTTIGVGHSNGGIVLRQARLNGKVMRGLLTVGSPNFGASAADHIRQGTFGDLLAPIVGTGALISYLFANPDASDLSELYYWYEVLNIQVLTQAVNLAFNTLDFDPGYSIWNSMHPASAYMVGLNSPSSLSAQAQLVPIRGNIRTRINQPDNAVWRLFADEGAAESWSAAFTIASVTSSLAAFYFTEKYCYGGDYSYYAKCDASYQFFDLAFFLGTFEARYCAKMQNEVGFGPYIDTCNESDGVVPYENQRWGAPGFSADYLVVGPSHIQQTSDPLVRARIGQFFSDRNGIAPCQSGPAFTLSVTGPTSIQTNVSRTLQVTPLDRCGVSTAAATSSVVASSSNPNVLGVSVTGPRTILVSGGAPGTSTLTIRIDGALRTWVVSVTNRPGPV
jgi:hypothetical protein